MEKTGFLILIVFILAVTITASAKSNNFSLGALFLAGGRYDDLRMCVASDAEVKGGPMADIQLAAKYQFNNTYALAFHLPIMRPILFWTAFDMLQFEPEFVLERKRPIGENLSLVTGPGLGASFHYGPDYTSNLDNRGKDFFAAGPYISFMTGIIFSSGDVLGLKAIYVPLFSAEHDTGTVIGGAIEYTVFW